jgi:2'-5' RNA ligase
VARNRRSEERPSGRPGSPRARLFVALELPPPVRDRLAAWRDEAITGRDDLRPVAADSLHVTLAFLGYRPEKEIAEIGRVTAEAVEACAPCRLAPAEVLPLPPRRPRLFALDLDDQDGLARRAQAALSKALARGRFYRPEKREFWPHVTLARVKRDRRAEPLEAAPPQLERFEASEVVLYRSTLRPQGAIYDPLVRTRLGAG